MPTSDLRALLDSAAVELHRAEDSIGLVRITISERHLEGTRETRQELVGVVQNLYVLRARLIVRLGLEHPAAKTFNAAITCASVVRREAIPLEAESISDRSAATAHVERAAEAFSDASGRFIDAAVELAGTRRPTSSSGTDVEPAPPESA